MSLNIIIDTYEIDTKEYILNILKESIQDIKEISYDNIQKPMIIFKEISQTKELQEFKVNKYPHTVIFIVDNRELMFESLKQYPLSFIRKQKIKEDLSKAIQLILDIHKHLEHVLTLKIGYSYIQTKVSHITYIESYGHYLIIHTLTGKYKVREQLKEILSKINQQDFIQVHKSFIINTKYIKEKRSNQMLLKCNTIIPIGRKYKTM